MRVLAICFVVVTQLTLFTVGPQAASTGNTAEVVCTFEDGKEMKVQYSRALRIGVRSFTRGKSGSWVDLRCSYLPRLRLPLAAP